MKNTLSQSSLALLLEPSSIAIVGASATREWATGNQVIRNLKQAGYSGRVEVVNPTGSVIEGIQSGSSIAEVPAVELAVIAVGPALVLRALEEAHEAGVRAAMVMSVGLEADALQQISEFSCSTGMLVHGPNCMGVINTSTGAMIWADEGILTDLPEGSISLISQSGSGAIFVARSMTGVGFANVISTGNEAALSTADYLLHLADDARTEVIGIIVESIEDADAFSDAVRSARERGKSVVALKVGRSTAGAAATVAHTGAVLADDAIVTALFERVGVPLVADYDELASALELLAQTRGRAYASGRVAVLTISGGQAALAADLADVRCTPLAQFDAATVAQLKEALPGVHVNNPLDAGGSTQLEDDYFERSLQAVASDPEVDVVVSIVDSQATLTDIEIGYEDELVDAMRAVAGRSSKPFVIASSSSLSIHPRRIPAARGDVPVIRGIGNAFAAINAATTAAGAQVKEPIRPSDLPDAQAVEDFDKELQAQSGAIDHELARRLLTAYGLPFVRSATAPVLETGIEFAGEIGYPVVLKVVSPDIAHRSDIGAVITDIADADALSDAWRRICRAVTEHRPDARIDGMEIQEQLGTAIEAFVGAVSDPRLGSTVGAGLGGVWVELLKDSAHGLAPLGPVEARALLERTKLHKLLAGYRNLHAVTDLAPLAKIIARVSWMMRDLGKRIGECDFNPVLIEEGTGRAVLIDSLVVARPNAS